MAIKKVLSVFDDKVGAFSQPFMSVNRQAALRDFQRAVEDQNLDLFHFPDDYVLFELGEFDDESGLITAVTPPVFLSRGSAFKKGA